MEQYWKTQDPNVFCIGGKNILIAKRGRAQAEQIVALNHWLKTHVAPLAQGIKEQDLATGWQLLMGLAEELSVEAQIELAQMVVGKTAQDGTPLPDNFVEEHYDIDWVVDGLQMAGKAAAVQRIITALQEQHGIQLRAS